MSSYKRKEVMDYLTRKPVTPQDIELARTRIQTPVAPLPMQVTSGEELGMREGFSNGTTLPINPMLDNVNPNTIGGAAIVPTAGITAAAIADRFNISLEDAGRMLKRIYTGPDGLIIGGDRLTEEAKPKIETFPSAEKQETTLVTKKPDQIKTDIGLTPPTIDTKLPGLKPDTGEDTSVLYSKKIKPVEKNYDELKQFIIDNYYVNKEDPNLFPAIQKYSEKFGGNLSNTAKDLGLDRRGMVQAGERRGFKFEGKGSTSTTKVEGLDYGNLTNVELASLVKENPNYLKELVKDKKINPNDFYSVADIAKIFGLAPDKMYRDNIARDYIEKKSKTYERGRITNEPVETISDPKKEQYKLYKLNDVIDNIEKDVTFKSKKPISGIDTDISKIRKELDPQLFNLVSNFKTKKNIIINKQSDPALTQALVNNPKIGTEGIFFDYGHSFAIENYRNFDFVKKNADKIYSLNRSVIQDPYINRTILAKTQGQEKNLFSDIDNFFKEYKGKTFDKEAIAKAQAINKEANDLFNKRQGRIKEFVNERAKSEPYLVGQENTLSNIHIDIKPGKKISDTDIKVFGDIDLRHSFGNIKNINPKANYFSDLTKKQQEMFKQNMIDQNINYSKSVLKQSKFDPKTIKDFEESMLFGPTAEKEGFIDKKGAPKFNKGGRVKLANGTEEPYNPEIPSLGETDPIAILEQQMANEKDPIKILVLDELLYQKKKRQAEKEKAREEEKAAQKAKGIRYKEDFPSEAAYFAETGKQLLTNPKYFLGKGAKGVVEGTEFLIGQPLQTLFSQEGKNWEFYQPVAGEKLGINKFIEENIPKGATTGTLLAGDVTEIAGSIIDPFLAYGIIKGATTTAKTKAPITIEEKIDPTRRDILKTGAVLTGGAIMYPTAKKLGLLDASIKATKTANAVRVATNPIVDNMPEFFPYLSEFSRRRGKIIGEDYMRSGMTEFKREITIPLELNTIEKTKTNVTFEFIHNPAEGNVTAYYTNPLTDEKHMFDFYTGQQGRQRYGIDPEFPNATEFYTVEVEPPGFYYKSPNKADPYRKDYEYYDTATEGDDVIQALDKWYKGLSKEEKAKFESKFVTHSEYTDEIPSASYENTDENYPIMDFMYPKKKND